MTFDDYIPLAMRTAKTLPLALDIDHGKMLLISEVGEVVDCLKKHVIYGKELDTTNLLEECGDLCWGIALLSSRLGFVPEVYPVKSYRVATDIEMVYLMAQMASNISTGDIRFGCSSLLNAVSSFLSRFDFTLEQAMEKNIAKLAVRYGDKYSDYAALNRDLSAEAEVLG